mgnify:CR=1 FL=1
MPDWLTSILLGIIEGITEFLPISSTGHLLVPQQLGWLAPQSDVFNIAIQSGAVVAVLFNFTDRVKQLTLRWREPEARDYLAKLLVAFVITGVGGLLIDKLGFELPETVLPVAVAVLVGGVLFVVVEKKIGNRVKLAEVTWAIAIAVGFGQLLAAVFPGTSRSGATILIALLMGLRLNEGVDLDRIAALSGLSTPQLVDERAIAQLIDIGLLHRQGTRLQVAAAGMLLLDAILPEIVTV